MKKFLVLLLSTLITPSIIMASGSDQHLTISCKAVSDSLNSINVLPHIDSDQMPAAGDTASYGSLGHFIDSEYQLGLVTTFAPTELKINKITFDKETLNVSELTITEGDVVVVQVANGKYTNQDGTEYNLGQCSLSQE